MNSALDLRVAPLAQKWINSWSWGFTEWEFGSHERFSLCVAMI